MPRILVVEDDTWMASLIADDLTDRGYAVSLAHNGVEALARLEAHRPDAIVLDLMMPSMHGWDFIDTYRQYTGERVVPIVVVSAAGAVPRSAAPKGVRHFLAKPFDIEELADSVCDAVNAAKAGGVVAPMVSSLEAITPVASAGVDASRSARAPAPI